MKKFKTHEDFIKYICELLMSEPIKTMIESFKNRYEGGPDRNAYKLKINELYEFINDLESLKKEEIRKHDEKH